MYNDRLRKRYVAGNIGSLENDEVFVSGSTLTMRGGVETTNK